MYHVHHPECVNERRTPSQTGVVWGVVRSSAGGMRGTNRVWAGTQRGVRGGVGVAVCGVGGNAWGSGVRWGVGGRGGVWGRGRV